MEEKQKLGKAHKIVKVHLHSALGGGLIPFTGLDIAAVLGIQMSMINSLSKLYGVDFSKNAVSSSLTSLIGSVLPFALSRGVFNSLLKIIPLVGTTLASVSMPVFSAAFTSAIGRVYIQHFEAGGDVFNFDPKEMKETFKAAFTEAKQEVKQEVKDSA